MALVVQKYGGSSVSDVDAMRRVARRIVATRQAGNTVVVVVSAMGDTTDELLDQAAALTTDAPAREMDILLSAGERISMALLAMAVGELGVPARAYTGAQAGVLTDSKYGRASIVGVIPERIARTIQMGAVAVVAGFQGINEVEDVTTLGRGGSDTTAVALAAALNADVCEIYTDVDGLFTADPRIVPTARRIESLTSEETLEMAANGAKILHLRAVEYARRFGVPLHVRSSFSDKTGTWIYDGRREGALRSAAAEHPGHRRGDTADVRRPVGGSDTATDHPGTHAARSWSLHPPRRTALHRSGGRHATALPATLIRGSLGDDGLPEAGSPAWQGVAGDTLLASLAAVGETRKVNVERVIIRLFGHDFRIPYLVKHAKSRHWDWKSWIPQTNQQGGFLTRFRAAVTETFLGPPRRRHGPATVIHPPNVTGSWGLGREHSLQTRTGTSALGRAAGRGLFVLGVGLTYSSEHEKADK